MNDPWPRPTQGPAKTIETDYLVIGAGAMGMAFTDTLITESGARRHDRPRMSTWWTLDHRLPVRAATPAIGLLRRQLKGTRQQHH